jgi:16S rRNA (cytosine1402-N4)-methyltransferase
MDARGIETAAHLLNTASQEELADIFYYYGEEKQARRIASFVVEQRKEKAIERTDELVGVVEKAVPKRFWPKKIHVATKVFQGLRIAVNQEFENLERILQDGVAALHPGAVFCVISFHSLEDRLVKRAFLQNDGLEVLHRKPVVPSSSECKENPRARSAKLRAARKVRNNRGDR